jgi:flagellar basal-body rod protein FlgC
MSFFTTLIVSGSALQAERLRVDLASANLANANATRTPEGGPYRRRDPVFEAIPVERGFGRELARALRRVEVERVVVDPRPPREIFDPSHPDANAEGIVLFPNVEVTEELVNLMNAARSYEANISAINASREMVQRALRIGRLA